MITYRTDDMRDVRHLWPFMAKVQNRIPYPQYLNKIDLEAVHPMYCTSAWDDTACVGTMMYWPAIYKSRAVELARELGLDPHRYILRTNIYVRPEYRREGISRELYRLQNAHAMGLGHDAGIGFGYETNEILSWALNVPGVETTLLEDKSGNPVVTSVLSC